MYFTLFPPISIEGTAVEKSVDISGLEALKSVRITTERVSCVIDVDGIDKTFDVIDFNDPVPDVNHRLQPDADFPLELMPLVTIEFLEEIAKKIEGYTLIFSEPPKAGYFEFYRGDLYPISIRGSDKQLYALTAELRPLRKDYFVALNTLLEIDFEEQLETSLATFSENVLKPMSVTMNEVFSLDRELNSEESIVNIIGSDFKRLISRTDELITIVNYNMDQTAERNKAFLRLTLPLMLKQALLENFTEYLQFESQESELKLKIIKRRSLLIEDLWEIIHKSFK
ncbi:MAG: hypothetical protein JSW11_19375 [Candidatus Heimdallarchaeota archaeon]|nr:MAG: hypothetical protein JSW11_19375 [Candidatus Heimdallarchaeota archaeon]